MRLSYLFFALPLFLSACSSTPTPVKEVKPEPIVKVEFAKVLDNNFRGLFYLRGNKAYFSGCGTEQKLPVYAGDNLRKIYDKMTARKSLPVYIEFTGEIVFAKDKAAESNILMRIDRVHHMALAKTSLQCAKPVSTFRFRAKGDEPYWRLNIDNQKLHFANKVRNQAYQIQNSNFQTMQANTIKSINKKEEPLNLTIEPGHCYDLKNNEYWGYTAMVETIWGKLQGCGESGWPVLEQKFTGYYLSKTPAKVSNLTLNEDYTVEYSEKNRR
jgi:putative lipoprotein